MVKLMPKTEVWKVHIITQLMDDDTEKDYYVAANCAGKAENKALALADDDGIELPACTLASFYMYIDG